MIFANHAVLKILGKSWTEIRGKSDDEWHDDPQEGRRFVEADTRIMASGVTEKLEEVLTGVEGMQTYLSTKSPLFAEDGSVLGIFGISMNITDRKNAENLREIVLAELDHRIKNTLALVQAMARQTFKHAGIDKAIWLAFEKRLISMAKAHDLLTRQSWVGADIADIVAEGLMAHGGEHADCFVISGPPAWVDAQTALSLAMALHELGTNALKYGALSIPDGRVSITWRIEIDEELAILNLHWKESGGPQVAPPAHQGFGSRLIQQAFGHLGSDVARVDYVPTGVEFQARFNLAKQLAKKG